MPQPQPPQTASHLTSSPDATTTTSQPNLKTRAQPRGPPTSGTVASTATNAPRARSPLLMTMLVAGLTVTGTLYGASLKQRSEDRAATAAAETSSKISLTTPGAVASGTIVGEAEQIKRAKETEASIKRLEEARARLMIVKVGLDEKLGRLREKMEGERRGNGGVGGGG